MSESAAPTRDIGYARVSTAGQTLETQLQQLKEQGCVEVFCDTASGARADRRELQKLMARLQPGDTVLVTRIDRLARSVFDLFSLIKTIHDAGARFRSLAQPWADTGTSSGRLMLAVLGGVAELERELILSRTAEGRERARRRGKHLGRPAKLTPEQRAEALTRLAAGEPAADIARTYAVNRMTIRRLRP